MNWKVKTKNISNELKTYYVDTDTKEDALMEFNDEYVVHISRNYEILKYKITYKQLKDVVDEWYSLLDAGFDDLNSLRIVKENCYHKKLKNVFDSILLDITKGNSVQKAFYKQKKYFPPIFMEVLNVSIKSNDLKNGLKLISNHLDDEIRNKDKMKNMTLYPKIIGIVIFVVICILSKFIIPSYVELFNNTNVELNKLSSILIKLFTFIGNNIFLIICSFLLIILVLIVLNRNQKFKLLFNNLKGRIPYFGKTIAYLNTYMFCSMTELLWKNHVNKIDSLKIVADGINDGKMRTKLYKAYNDVINGLSISESLIKYRIFDNVLIKMFVIGEKNNMMMNNIENAVKYYRYKYHSQLKRMLTILEPVLLLSMSVFVMIIILVVFIPMLNAFRMVG